VIVGIWDVLVSVIVCMCLMVLCGSSRLVLWVLGLLLWMLIFVIVLFGGVSMIVVLVS